MFDLDKLIETANGLEPLPDTVTRLMELLSEDDVDVEDIEEIFSYDGPLTGRLLRQANSALSASRAPIGTIGAAVVRLGLGGVTALAVSASAQKRLSQAVPEYGISEGGLWRHAQASRLAVEATRKFGRVKVPPEAQSAALLHDIGKAVIAHHLDGELLRILREAAGEGEIIGYRLEKEVLEVNHAELGGLIAQNWRLPEAIIKGITYHHEPEACDEEHQHICHITCFANWAAKFAESSLYGETFDDPPPASAALIGLDERKTASIIAFIIEGLEMLGYAPAE